jgi:class 3 adenylate cyclase/tetratricopeptide (TPR) repeat protein
VTVCPSCAAAVPADAKFCHECGARMTQRSCPSCGAPVERGRFCNECGAALDAAPGDLVGAPARAGEHPVAERRVTSVLFGDLVGFTPLSESRDAEEVRELLSRYYSECRTVVARYGGQVEKFIGDAVMAVWGVPLAHEDDAERAVRAGLELVQATVDLGDDVGAPGLAMRVGVVTGEVAVTLGAQGEGMVAGDAVNTAARVQSAAEPGSVWVDEATRSLTAAAIAFEDAGEHALKGKAEPARLWRAVSVVSEVGGGQRMDGLEAPLTGRAREMRLVKELFHATDESQRPRLVVVDGDPGVGKSRLAWEFFKYIDGLSDTVRWHRGRCLSYGDGVAFWALAEAIRARLGLVETDSGEVVAEHLEQGLAEFVPDADERDWLRPRLAALVAAGAAGEFAREDLFAGWTTFLERVGAGDPVVLVIDDAQYADNGLLDFVEHLLATARAGVLVLALARPELLARRPDLGGRRATVIRLDPLDDAAMATLVDGLVHGLPAETRTALVARAEGVPLFAVETVRALIDRDAVVPHEGRYVPADGIPVDLASIGAPASLQAVVAARLDSLAPQERQVIADASVLGLSFTRDSLAAVSNEEVDLDQALTSLQRKEILAVQVDRFSAERGQYRFVQSVMRQVAYATQSRRDRKARHLAAADYLSGQPDTGDDLAVVIAQHLLDAVDASASTDTDLAELTRRARDLLERAARRGRRLGSPAEAQRLLESALTRADDPGDRARLHQAAASSAFDAGDYAGAVHHAAEAEARYDTLGEPVDAGVAAATRALALTSLGDNSGSIEVAEPRWKALDGTAGAEPALLQLAAALSTAHEYLGDHYVGAGYAERRIRLAEAVDDAASLASAQIALGIHFWETGAPITGHGLLELAASTAREHGDNAVLARALNNLTTLQVGRDLGAALASGREGIAAARRSGVRRLIEITTCNYVLALWTAGRLDDTRAVLTESEETTGDPVIILMNATVEAWLAQAEGLPLPVGPDTLASDDETSLAWQDCLALMHAQAEGDTVAAARTAQACMTHLLAASGIEDDFVHLWPRLVQAAVDAGDLALADRLLEPVTGAAAGIVSPALAAQCHRLVGLVAAARGGEPERVEAELRAAVDALEAFGAAGLHARAEEELGRWLHDQGRDADARPLLASAAATYRDMAAAGWLSELTSWQTERAGSPA